MSLRRPPGLCRGLLVKLLKPPKSLKSLKPLKSLISLSLLSPLRLPRSGAITAMIALFLNACGPIVRPYYNRDLGGYLRPDPSLTPAAEVPESLKGNLSGDRLQKISESYLGVPYRFGGQSRSGMDCSGFIGQVFSEAYGIKLPRNSAGMFKKGKAIAKSDLKPGDVVFFKRLGYVDHSGIYMGKNYFIHSATSVGVAYSTLSAPYFRSHYAGARRIVAAP